MSFEFNKTPEATEIELGDTQDVWMRSSDQEAAKGAPQKFQQDVYLIRPEFRAALPRSPIHNFQDSWKDHGKIQIVKNVSAKQTSPDSSSALGVANYFLRCVDIESGDLISPLKLQKLVYYGQAWTLVLLSKPLFRESIEAWVHGPVVYSIWKKFQHYKHKAIPQPDPDKVPEFDTQIIEVLDEVWSTYGELSARHLEELTHAETPWQKARGDLSPDEKSKAIIRHEDMRAYYSSLLEQKQN